jgi:hypothetical protein
MVNVAQAEAGGRAGDLGSIGGYGRGLVAGDQDTHAVTLTDFGPVARCSGAAIGRRLPGLFQGSDPLACSTCAYLQFRASEGD